MSALTAFDAVSRLGNFTHAATELGVTQGAVSRQVKVLEDFVGAPLLRRRKLQSSLTAAGEIYAREVRRSLDKIGAATLTVMSEQRGNSLHVAILPAFGGAWLIPRIRSFLNTHPQISVKFFTRYYQPVDFAADDIDIAVHYGGPDRPGFGCDHLFGDVIIPVCSPSFLGEHPFATPQDLLNVPLLHEATRPNAWPDWFAANGVVTEALGASSKRNFQIEQFSIVTQAAVAGLGLAVLPIFLIENELKRGDLVVAIDRPLPSQSAYYLMWPIEKSDYRPLRAFRRWVLELAHSEGTEHGEWIRGTSKEHA